MDDQLIKSVSDFRDDVLSRISNRDIVSFKLGDIDFGEEINVGGARITETAIGRILTSLKVQKGFLNYKKKMTKEQWAQVRESLQDVNKNTEFLGRKVINSSGNASIIKLYQKNESLIDQEQHIGFNDYFDMIITALEGTNIDYDVKSMYFDDSNERATLRFIDKNSELSVFSDVTDSWKRGIDMNFDLLQYSSAPLFERLVCTNGMVASQYGYATSIRNQSFKMNALQKEINRLLIKGDANRRLDDMLKNAADHLRNTDISINEFYEYRNFFSNRNNDHCYDHILGKFFSESPLYKSYGVDIKEQSEKWLSTATSGRNGYDFFNDLTWLASHPVESRIGDEDARDLQIKMSHLFFKEKLDLEDIAPKVNLSLGKVIERNN